MKQEIREILGLLVQNATRIESFSFLRRLREDGINIEFSEQEDGNNTWTYTHPDEEATIAATALIRTFFQKSTPFSFVSIQNLFTDPDLSDDWKLKTDQICDDYFIYIHEYDPTYVEMFDGQPNRLDILDTVLYGGLVHFDKQKVARFQLWCSDEFSRNMIRQVFASILGHIIDFISQMRVVTEEELENNP